MGQKSVIIADDHPVFRMGIKHILQNSDNFHVIGEASNTNELFRVLERRSCDLVLLDMKMERRDAGLTALQVIKETHPAVKVVLMSQYYTKSIINESMELGVDGYVTKEDIAETLLYVLASVFAGERAYSPKVQKILLEKIDAGDIVLDKLTKRELEVLKLLAEGMKRQEIAEALNISVPTVDFHKNSIKGKLQTDSLAGLINIYHKYWE